MLFYGEGLGYLESAIPGYVKVVARGGKLTPPDEAPAEEEDGTA